MSSNFFALHGFLGSGLDWEPLKNCMASEDAIINWVTPSLFSDEFAERDLVSFQACIEKLRTMKSQSEIFVGYSLGARIGLYWASKYPHDFLHWVLISCHPGLQTSDDRQNRLLSDRTWIEKLNKLSILEFAADWNSQKLFKNSTSAIANLNDSDFFKKRLVYGLENLSLANQFIGSDTISGIKDRLSWVVGKEDQKFLELAKSLIDQKLINNCIEVNAGHRAHLDNPKHLSDCLNRILKSF